jgi:hypothetical protein
MSKQMDWRRARLHGRPSLDIRYEHDIRDRADRWLAAVERRQQAQRPHPRERQGFSVTQPSSL